MEQQDPRREAAIERITDRRELRQHVTVYLAVNILLVVIWAATGAGYFWPIWSIGGWGLGLALHAWRVRGDTPITESAIRQEMDRVDADGHRTAG